MTGLGSQFDDMACAMIGDGNLPNIYFVTCNGVRAILDNERAAVAAAQEYGEETSVLVEDCLNGEVWGNRYYYDLLELQAEEQGEAP